MANVDFKPISGTSKEAKHPGLHLFGWCITGSAQSRLDDLNPFASMSWRNFDIGISVEKSSYTGGALEVSVSLLVVAFFFEAYRMEGREKFAAPINEIREAVDRGEVKLFPPKLDIHPEIRGKMPTIE